MSHGERPRSWPSSRRATRPRWRSSSDGRRIVTNVVASQVALHSATGGIVPEVAARAHLRWMIPVLDEARRRAGIDGLVGARGRRRHRGPWPRRIAAGRHHHGQDACLADDLPLVPVNHLEGHIYAAWLLDPGRGREAGARVPAGRARRQRRPYLPRRDGRPPALPAAGPDRRRCRGGGVRQGRPAARACPIRAGRRS